MNLDELNQFYANFYTDQEKAQAFDGLFRGANGAPCPTTVPAPFSAGYDLGVKWRMEAEVACCKQSEAGKASAAKRRLVHGTAQPSPNAVREITEGRSEEPRTNEERRTNNEEQEPRREVASLPNPSQHPEKEAEPQTEAPSSQIAAHAQASDAALTPKQQTPSPHLAGPPSPKACEPRIDLPRHLDTPAFREAWAEFEQHRRQIKAPLTDLARRKLVKKLSPFDEQTCIQAFDASISSAWSGVFPESVKSGRRAPQQVYSMNKI